MRAGGAVPVRPRRNAPGFGRRVPKIGRQAPRPIGRSLGEARLVGSLLNPIKRQIGCEGFCRPVKGVQAIGEAVVDIDALGVGQVIPSDQPVQSIFRGDMIALGDVDPGDGDPGR